VALADGTDGRVVGRVEDADDAGVSIRGLTL
jgi:hypothetical protein